MSLVRPCVAFDRVFVGRVPRGTTESQLRDAFSIAGVTVRGIELVMDRVTGLPRGFAFATLRDRSDTLAGTVAVERLRAATLDGQLFDIQGVPRH